MKVVGSVVVLGGDELVALMVSEEEGKLAVVKVVEAKADLAAAMARRTS